MNFSNLWGNLKFREGLTNGEDFFLQPQDFVPQNNFYLIYCSVHAEGGITLFNLQLFLPTKPRKKPRKFNFCPSFHSAVRFLCLSSVPG